MLVVVHLQSIHRLNVVECEPWFALSCLCFSRDRGRFSIWAHCFASDRGLDINLSTMIWQFLSDGTLLDSWNINVVQREGKKDCQSENLIRLESRFYLVVR